MNYQNICDFFTLYMILDGSYYIWEYIVLRKTINKVIFVWVYELENNYTTEPTLRKKITNENYTFVFGAFRQMLNIHFELRALFW